MNLMDALIQEAAETVAGMRTADDLDRRIGELRDRAEVPNDRLAAFIVAVPEGYTTEDKATFKRVLSHALECAIKDAEAEVKFLRTWGDK